MVEKPLAIVLINNIYSEISQLNMKILRNRGHITFRTEQRWEKTTKSALCEVRNEHTYPSGFSISHKTALFLDGGYLLQLVVWPMPATYERVITGYVTFITYLIN